MTVQAMVAQILSRLSSSTEWFMISNWEVLFSLSNAVNYIYTYDKWSWTFTNTLLELWEWETAKKEWDLDHEIFALYKVFSGDTELKKANSWWELKDTSNSYYLVWQKIYTSEEVESIELFYHKWAGRLYAVTGDDLGIPDALLWAVYNLTMWDLLSVWLEQGANLANQHYNIWESLLKQAKWMYWMNLNPDSIVPNKNYF